MEIFLLSWDSISIKMRNAIMPIHGIDMMAFSFRKTFDEVSHSTFTLMPSEWAENSGAYMH